MRPDFPDTTDILEQLKAGNSTPRSLTEKHIQLTEDLHPKLNATTHIRKEEIQAELEHLPQGPLHGVPISVKECYALQGEMIRSGSLRMPPIACQEDAVLVKKLKAAGAVIIARSNTSEFLMHRETRNLIYGQTNNPINSKLTAGGSSGGEGSLVGSGCSFLGIGTDIGGSIRYPSAFCGCVGFRPHSSTFDKTGVFPGVDHFAETMNGLGPITRSVRDTRLVYPVLSDKNLPERSSVSGYSLLIAANFNYKIADDSIQLALNNSIAGLVGRGMKKESISVPDPDTLHFDFSALMIDGFFDKMREWSTTKSGEKFSMTGETLRKLSGHPTLSNDIYMLFLLGKTLQKSKSKTAAIAEKIKTLRPEFYKQLGDGIMILPTVGVLALPHGQLTRKVLTPWAPGIITMISFCNILDVSVITVPAWKYQKDKLSSPPGIMLLCAPGNEAKLLDVAETLEEIAG